MWLVAFILFFLAAFVIFNLFAYFSMKWEDEFSAKRMNKIAEDYTEEIDRIKNRIEQTATKHEYKITIDYPGENVCNYFIDKKFFITKNTEEETVTINWEDANEHNFRLFD